MGKKREQQAIRGEVVTLAESSKRVYGRPFEPGVATNPGGLPRGTVSLTRTIARRLTQERADAIADALIERAEAGSLEAVQTLLDRLDGKVAQRVESVSLNLHAVSETLGELSVDEMRQLRDQLRSLPAPQTE